VSALRWALNHPLNRRRQTTTFLRWAFHNTRRRMTPRRDITLRFGNGLVDGPVDHPVINLILYVRGGYYDYEAMTALTFLLRPGQGFIDIGANIGPYSVMAGELVGAAGRVLAVEPLADQLVYLRRNLARIPASSIVCTAPLADARRSMSMVGAGATTHYLGESSAGSTVMTSTLDAELAAIGWQGTGDFAKIDIEGWEPAALLGAREWLASGPDGLILEANGLNRRCPVPWSEAVKVLRDHNMDFTWPNFETNSLHIFEDPGPESPFSDYLVLSPESRRLLEQGASLHSKAT
jgi:FkbM family methyltransferase